MGQRFLRALDKKVEVDWYQIFWFFVWIKGTVIFNGFGYHD